MQSGNIEDRAIIFSSIKEFKDLIKKKEKGIENAFSSEYQRAVLA